MCIGRGDVTKETVKACMRVVHPILSYGVHHDMPNVSRSLGPSGFQAFLPVFADFFRKMFDGNFDIDADLRVLWVFGLGKRNDTLKTARCLEHALRVCREDGFKVLRRSQANGSDGSFGEGRYLFDSRVVFLCAFLSSICFIIIVVQE